MTSFRTSNNIKQSNTDHYLWLRCLLVLLTLLPSLLASCSRETASYSLDDRKEMESIVRATLGTDSLGMLQKRLQREGNRLGSIIALREWGKALRNESRFEEALRVHSEALQQVEILGDTLEWVQALNNVGTNYRRMGVLDVAQDYHYRAWMMSEECSDTTFIAKKNRVVSLNGLGNIYMTLGNYERADSVLRMALKGEEELKSAVGMAINYANLGSIFEHRGETDSAWLYYRKSMALNVEENNELGISLCHTYFGSLYEQAHQYDKATREYESAYRLMQASKDEWHAVNTLIALAGVYHATHDEAKTIEYLGRAKRMAEAIKSPEHLAEIYVLYYKHYKQVGDYSTALSSYEQAISMRDRVLNMEKVNRIQNMSLNIERNRQTREMAAAKLKLDEERAEHRIGYTIFAFVVMILVGALGVFFYIQRVHRRNHLALKKLSVLREGFFTNITHEFRTPLTIILGLSHDLQTTSTGDVREKAQTIERQGNGLLVLINQLLDISKIKSSVGDPDWRNGDITAYLTMIVETYHDHAHSQHIDLHLLVKEKIEMDFVPDYVNKVMNNLLSNAFKFTPTYGKINVTVWREDEQLHIDVEDTGKGMDRETASRVFEPFYQGESDSRNIGTGVGLALVKQIIDAVEGSITVESTPGKGTIFKISVPIHNNCKQQVEEMQAHNVPELPTGETTLIDSEDSGSQCHLLVIEDNHDIAAYIGGQFVGRYSVSYATDGVEGLEKALALVPDLIITDLMMPGMDGLELCRQVRNSEIINHVPIIVVTAKITEEERLRGIEAGADVYLAKPFSSDELRMRVEKLLEGRRMLREKFAQMLPENRNSNILEKVSAPEPDSEDVRFLFKVSSIVHRQLNKSGDIDVALVASNMCMSTRQLHRKIHALTGYAPSAYILRVKIGKAKNLLDDHPQMSFGEVAEQCGFGDYSNFVRGFKNVLGLTPTEYRAQREASATL